MLRFHLAEESVSVCFSFRKFFFLAFCAYHCLEMCLLSASRSFEVVLLHEPCNLTSGYNNLIHTSSRGI